MSYRELAELTTYVFKHNATLAAPRGYGMILEYKEDPDYPDISVGEVSVSLVKNLGRFDPLVIIQRIFGEVHELSFSNIKAYVETVFECLQAFVEKGEDK